jgi:hypothetical protein
MTRDSYTKSFTRNPEQLQEMLTLYDKGWRIKDLQEKFNVVSASIVYQLRKHGIKLRGRRGRQKGDKNWISYSIKPPKNYENIDPYDGKINEGKNYKDYLLEEKKRNDISTTQKKK